MRDKVGSVVAGRFAECRFGGAGKLASWSLDSRDCPLLLRMEGMDNVFAGPKIAVGRDVVEIGDIDGESGMVGGFGFADFLGAI